MIFLVEDVLFLVLLELIFELYLIVVEEWLLGGGVDVVGFFCEVELGVFFVDE